MIEIFGQIVSGSLFHLNFMDIKRVTESETGSLSVNPPPRLRQYRVVLSSPSSTTGSYRDTTTPALSNLSCDNDLLLEHIRRGTAGACSISILTTEAVRDLWYLPASYLAKLTSSKVSQSFGSGALTFENGEEKKNFEKFILQESEKVIIRWSIYSDFIEFKMPESRVHGQVSHEITRILENTLLQTLYIPVLPTIILESEAPKLLVCPSNFFD